MRCFLCIASGRLFSLVQGGGRSFAVLRFIPVTANPTAEWVTHQITEAFPWDEAPDYLIRDRDRIFGSVVTRRREGGWTCAVKSARS